MSPEVRENEYDFEGRFLEWFGQIGWNTHGSAETWGGKALAEQFGRTEGYPIYDGIIEQQIKQLNPSVTDDEVDTILDDIKSALRTQEGIVPTNKRWMNMLSGGIYVESLDNDRGDRGRSVQLADLENPENNRFDALRQFSYSQGTDTVRPDILLFVNGLPLAVGELKKSGFNGGSVNTAIRDIRDYEKQTPRLFYTSLFNFAATSVQLRYGAPTATSSYYFPWYPEDVAPGEEYGRLGYSPEQSVKSLFKPSTFIRLIRDYVFYNDDEQPDTKVIPRHQQYFGVETIKQRTQAARDIGKPARGLVWHTQGSGKSYAMYYAARYYAKTEDALSILLVDRDKLREQMARELSSMSPWFDCEKIESGSELAEVLKKRSKIALVTIQMFDQLQNVPGIDSLEDVQTRIEDRDVYIFTDEAHRYMESALGSELEAVLDEAHHYGFTGTPVQDGKSAKGRNTFENYGMPELDDETPYLHRYSMQRACDEGVITKVDITSHAGKLEYEIYPEQLDDELRQKHHQLSDDELKRAIRETASAEQIAEIDSRVEEIAKDVYEHYTKNVEPDGLKGMVVAPSREAAAKYAQKFEQLLDPDAVEVMYTEDEDDSGLLKEYHTSSEQRDTIIKEYKNEENPKLLVVCDMLLTGFDAPNLKTLYLDRRLKNHNLMQAIARTNRPKENKPFGQIIEYRNLTSDDAVFEIQEGDELDVYLTENRDKFVNELISKLKQLTELYKDKLSDRDEVYPKTVAEHVIRDPEKRSEFVSLFREARNIRQAIQPDGRLQTSTPGLDGTIDEKFKFLRESYSIIIKAEGDDDNPLVPDEIENDIDQLLDKGVNIENTGQDTAPTREIDSGQPENLNVVSKKAELQDVLSEREAQNPAFASLSERVRRVMEKWHNGEIESVEATEQLEDIEEEVEDKPSPDGNRQEWLNHVVRGVIQHQTDVENADDELIQTVVDRFEDEWSGIRKMNREKQLSKLSSSIQEELLKQAEDRIELAVNSDFPDIVATYLLRNTE